jgi:putative ABC transport system permease protein
MFRPVVKLSNFGINLRSILIGLQMLVSISVIASALIMYQQVSFMKNRPPGFERENKLIVWVNTIANGSDYRAVMTELSRHPDIYNVTMADQIPGTPAVGELATILNDQGEEINVLVDTYSVDENYLDTFSIPLVNGRNFSPGNRSTEDTSLFPYLVNESLVKQMGWADPIGKEIDTPLALVSGEVIGVFTDYNFSSLHEEIRPQLIYFFYDDWRWQRYLVMDVDSNNIQAILGYVERSLTMIMPETPFDYSFLDEILDGLYANEQNQTQLTLAGSGVSILVAILGLFGLTAFTIDQKTKEIGIRRVLGASVTRILAVMFKGIIVLIIVAAIVASVLVFYALNIWLEGFAYRISISPMIFVIAMLSVLVVSVLTVAIQCST